MSSQKPTKTLYARWAFLLDDCEKINIFLFRQDRRIRHLFFDFSDAGDKGMGKERTITAGARGQQIT